MTELELKPALLRSMVHADLELVLCWRNDPEVRRNMYTQHEISLDEHQCWFESAKANPKNHLLIFEVVYRPLGFVHFTETGSGGIADWGFYTAPDRPKGSGRQLGRAALSHAFTQMKLHKVCGLVLAYNQRSINFHLALGFRQEGIMSDQHFDGVRYHNVIRFGLLSHDWQLST